MIRVFITPSQTLHSNRFSTTKRQFYRSLKHFEQRQNQVNRNTQNVQKQPKKPVQEKVLLFHADRIGLFRIATAASLVNFMAWSVFSETVYTFAKDAQIFGVTSDQDIKRYFVPALFFSLGIAGLVARIVFGRRMVNKLYIGENRKSIDVVHYGFWGTKTTTFPVSDIIRDSYQETQACTYFKVKGKDYFFALENGGDYPRGDSIVRSVLTGQMRPQKKYPHIY
eukprot:TRINITY_DN5629_c0_g1_i1.p1 TRINITY_DN5629_c0_g1~~TRINITY_DN5629_c0_g1_i1.p1  ORF type:complete len:224 (-),score=47.32 TRINITY_DN5629_c0_g1_i1:23-694(-)